MKAAARARTLRALAQLLTYPDARLRSMLPALAAHFEADTACSPAVREALGALIAHLRARDPFDVEADYVDCFDRGRASSLLLFEHVYADSRDRGQAMIDLLDTYERAGLRLQPGQLPDWLPAVLEFASTQPPKHARAFLGELAALLNALHTALVDRRSRYAAVIAAVLELAGERVRHVALPPEEALDEAWAEPPAFGGCSTHGQSAARDVQPVHFVRGAGRGSDATGSAVHGSAAQGSAVRGGGARDSATFSTAFEGVPR
ncbi:MAG: nitrate reductase molybdenum cofactor assembly chaperone [Limnobacter sp.]|nr:nitrate reductase molybdenum cofactor assembly chaperone [Limnobacter sp.]